MRKSVMKLRVLVYLDRDTNKWIAQGLEKDIVAQAVDINSLMERLEETTKAILATGKLDVIPKAPQMFFREWDKNPHQIKPKRRFQEMEQFKWELYTCLHNEKPKCGYDKFCTVLYKSVI